MAERSRSPERRAATIERKGEPTLFVRAWEATVPRRGTLVLVHGLGEHGDRYRELVERFTGEGWRVVAGDLRGFGRSEGRRGHVRSFDGYVRDVEAVVRWSEELDAIDGRTVGSRVVYGHSMGGVVATRFALDAPPTLRPDVLVLSSPGFAAHADAKPNPLLHAAAFVLARVAPRFHIASGLDPSAVSRDPAVVEAYRADPLVEDRVTPAWYVAFLAAQKDAAERFATLSMPAIVMQAGADTLVDPTTVERVAEGAPSDRVTYRSWPGLFHELHQEPEKQQVFDWVLEQLDVSSPAGG